MPWICICIHILIGLCPLDLGTVRGYWLVYVLLTPNLSQHSSSTDSLPKREPPPASQALFAPPSTLVCTTIYHAEIACLILSLIDYSQCIPGTATTSSSPPSSSAPSTGTPAGALPRLGGVNTAGYDFSVVCALST